MIDTRFTLIVALWQVRLLFSSHDPLLLAQLASLLFGRGSRGCVLCSNFLRSLLSSGIPFPLLLPFFQQKKRLLSLLTVCPPSNVTIHNALYSFLFSIPAALAADPFLDPGSLSCPFSPSILFLPLNHPDPMLTRWRAPELRPVCECERTAEKLEERMELCRE